MGRFTSGRGRLRSASRRPASWRAGPQHAQHGRRAGAEPDRAQPRSALQGTPQPGGTSMPARLRKHAIAAAMLATAAAAALFATASPASGDRVTVKGATIATYHYAPRTLQVEKGDTVHWHWSSNAPHNVTFKKIGAHSPTGAAETFSHKFKKVGTYKYFCSVHGFTGKIVVG